MRKVGVEPTCPKASDFESNASANSATTPRIVGVGVEPT